MYLKPFSILFLQTSKKQRYFGTLIERCKGLRGAKWLQAASNTFIFPRRIRHSVIHFNSRRKIILRCSAKFPTFDGRLKKEKGEKNPLSSLMLLKSPYTHPLCPAYQLRWTPWTSDGFSKTRHHPFKCVKVPAAPLNCRIQSWALCTRCEAEPFDRSFTDVLNEVFSYTQNNPDHLKPHRKK